MRDRKPLPGVGRVFAYWRAERRTIKQGFVALWISSLGDLISGLTLAKITHTLELLPGLIVLVPAAIGMRGNIFGALGSRLGTSIHAGMFEASLRRRQSALYQNVYAVVVMSFSMSVALGILAKTISLAFGIRSMSIADFIAISIIGGVISSVVVGGLTVGIALTSNRRGWDLDSVSAPLVTAAGDIVTIPSLFIGTFVVHIHGVTAAVSIVAAIAALVVMTRGFVTQYPVARRAIRESLPILVIAGTIDVVAGLILEKRLNKFTALPVLAVLIPPFLEDAGSLGSILSSRLASKLHLGALSPRRWPEPPALLDFSLIFLFSISVFALVGTSANVVASVFHLASPGLVNVVGVSLLAGLISTFAAVVVAYYAAIATYRFGLDPDNHGIPLITSSMDLIGVIAIVIALVVFGLA